MDYYFSFYRIVDLTAAECPVHDPRALLVAADESLVRMQTWSAAIECGGDYAAGMVVADRRTVPTVGKSVRFAVEVDADRALRKLLSVFY